MSTIELKLEIIKQVERQDETGLKKNLFSLRKQMGFNFYDYIKIFNNGEIT